MSQEMRTVELELAWLKQEDWEEWPPWEQWWGVLPQGEILKLMPGLKDHVKVANYDLKRIGCKIIFGDYLLEIRGVPENKLGAVTQTVEKQGFQITSVS